MDIPRDEILPILKIPILNKGSDTNTDVGFMEIPKDIMLKSAIEYEGCTLDQVYTAPTCGSSLVIQHED
jgi:hypothetical protein